MRQMFRGRGGMKVMAGILSMALAATAAGAQGDAAAARGVGETYRTFNLSTVTQGNDAREISDALRNMLDPNVKVYLVPSQNAITLRASPEQMAIAEKLLTELDRPRKTYRLTYTITDIEGEKRVGVQHFTMIVVSGGRTSVKEGSKVPVATGSYSSGNANVQTQFTYLDVGMNFDASLDESVNGVRLRTKVERSSVGESKEVAGVNEPIVRQAVLEGTSILAPGKPLLLGALDLPESTRRLEVEAMIELVR